MKVNLEKELAQKNEERTIERQALENVGEMKLLLEATAVEERAVLRTFGLDENIRKVEEARGKQLESEQFTEEYGNVYQFQDIAGLAVQYRLRFLPLSKFRGGIDPLLATKMVAFGKKHGIDPNAYAENFYVLAPSEDFALTTEKHYRPRPVVAQDPLLFYRTDREGEFWTLIMKWGTEFNYFRLIRSLKYRNAHYYITHWSMVFTSVLLLAFTGLIGGFTVPMWLIALPCVVVGIVSAFIKFGCLEAADEKNLFTELNWTDDRFHKMVNWNE